MKFQKGDIIESKSKDGEVVYREIIKTRKNSYLWRYPDLPDHIKCTIENIFDTRNSNDPLLSRGWVLSNKNFN